jgi:hypothetical protein
MTRLTTIVLCIWWILPVPSQGQHALVFQTDFGTKDGAVAAMKGVAFGVAPDLAMFDLTHEIEAYNIYEAAYRLYQAAPYWPAGTVFVSVVDPGVGTQRKSVVLKTKSGHFFVTPDNGTLTFVARHLGVAEVRQIDEAVNRLKNSERSYTFHGRDVYAFTGARLAAGVIDFEGVGPQVQGPVLLSVQEASFQDRQIVGHVTVLDPQYGNVWTNIDEALLKKMGVVVGGKVQVEILYQNKVRYQALVPFVRTFGEVPLGTEMGYLNSLLQFSLAINQGNFAAAHGIAGGPDWLVRLTQPQR